MAIKSGKNKQRTFKTNVAEFWGWFPTVADRFFETIEAGDCEKLTNEVGKQCDMLLPTMAWVFGPGENNGHSFTVSGEGVVAKQLLAEYWQSRAPEIKGWTFYGSRQPASEESLTGLAIAVEKQKSVDTTGFLIKTNVDAEEERVDIVAWHPSLALVPEEHHLQILFLLLDEAMGEFGTETWIGKIAIEPFEAGTENTTLDKLPAFVRKAGDYYKWQKYSPLETYTVFQIEERTDDEQPIRFCGTTCIPDLINELIANEGQLEDNPLEGTGAELVYIAIDASDFPDGEHVNFRSKIEDAVSSALQADLSGRTLGGAFGPGEALIDVLILDGENSRQIIKDSLSQFGLVDKCRIVNFA
jgi:hypothetical protein